MRFERKFTSTRDLISVRVKYKKSRILKCTKFVNVQSSVQPKVKVASSTGTTVKVEKDVSNLATQIIEYDSSFLIEVKWKKLPHVTIKMEDSDSESEYVPSRCTRIPRTFKDVSTQTMVLEQAITQAENPVKNSRKKRREEVEVEVAGHLMYT